MRIEYPRPSRNARKCHFYGHPPRVETETDEVQKDRKSNTRIGQGAEISTICTTVVFSSVTEEIKELYGFIVAHLTFVPEAVSIWLGFDVNWTRLNTQYFARNKTCFIPAFTFTAYLDTNN